MDSLVSLTRSQKRRFKRLIQRSDNGRVVRRAQVLLQLASGVSPTAVSRSLSVARSTVYRWVTQFQTAGEAFLEACGSGRRAYTVDDTLLETLAELVEQPPSDYGYLRSTWTSEMLAETLNSLLSRPIHASTVRRWLVNLGFGWRRARPTLHLRDPRAATRLKAIHRALSRAPSGRKCFTPMRSISTSIPKSVSLGLLKVVNVPSPRLGKTGNAIWRARCTHEPVALRMSRAHGKTATYSFACSTTCGKLTAPRVELS